MLKIWHHYPQGLSSVLSSHIFYLIINNFSSSSFFWSSYSTSQILLLQIYTSYSIQNQDSFSNVTVEKTAQKFGPKNSEQ